MKTALRVIVFLAMVLLSVPVIHGQDLSKYRTFSLGMTLADLSKQIDANPEDVTVVHERPARIEELTWWPPQANDISATPEPVEQILFSFDNGALYRILVTYDSQATKGLTDEDMIRAVSAKYGVATRPIADIKFPAKPSYEASEKVIARWQDPQYELNLFRPSWSNNFAIVMFNKQSDAQAALSIAESVNLEQQEAPQKEAALVTKKAGDLEIERQKNVQGFRP